MALAKRANYVLLVFLSAFFIFNSAASYAVRYVLIIDPMFGDESVVPFALSAYESNIHYYQDYLNYLLAFYKDDGDFPKQQNTLEKLQGKVTFFIRRPKNGEKEYAVKLLGGQTLTTELTSLKQNGGVKINKTFPGSKHPVKKTKPHIQHTTVPEKTLPNKHKLNKEIKPAGKGDKTIANPHFKKLKPPTFNTQAEKAPNLAYMMERLSLHTPDMPPPGNTESQIHLGE